MKLALIAAIVMMTLCGCSQDEHYIVRLCDGWVPYYVYQQGRRIPLLRADL